MSRAAEPFETANPWYVAFYDTPDRRWWYCLTRRGYGHCAAFGFLPGANVWLVTEWNAGGLMVAAIDREALDDYIALVCRHGCVLEPPAGMKRRRVAYRPRLGLYCITAVTELLGLSTWALTPWQLACALRRRGAREMFTGVRDAWNDNGEPSCPS